MVVVGGDAVAGVEASACRKSGGRPNAERNDGIEECSAEDGING